MSVNFAALEQSCHEKRVAKLWMFIMFQQRNKKKRLLAMIVQMESFLKYGYPKGPKPLVFPFTTANLDDLGVPHGTSHIENLQSHEFRLAPCRGGV
jgi:cytochrome bd-type quinol oxidase subunit 1